MLNIGKTYIDHTTSVTCLQLFTNLVCANYEKMHFKYIGLLDLKKTDSPNCCAVVCKLGSPTAGNLSSQSTLFGTCFNIYTHMCSVNGSILYSWLKLQ